MRNTLRFVTVYSDCRILETDITDFHKIHDFIIFEDRLENSLQRDLIKMEHVRMRVPHEAINSELVDMELIELKFIFDRRMSTRRPLLTGLVPDCLQSTTITETSPSLPTTSPVAVKLSTTRPNSSRRRLQAYVDNVIIQR